MKEFLIKTYDKVMFTNERQDFCLIINGLK